MQWSEWIFWTVVLLLIFDFGFEKWLGHLNHQQWHKSLPAALKSLYPKEKYQEAKAYARSNYKMSLLTSAFSFVLILLVLYFGLIGTLDKLVYQWVGELPILSALVFFGVAGAISFLINLPFSVYSTFVIEEKFGFNKTNIKTFILDILKSSLLSIVIGGAILALIVKLYLIFGSNFWILTWVFLSVLMLFISMFYSSLIVPLFNKQTPLEPGELRDKIDSFAQKVGFKLDNIYVIDGSKRSTKANAYFSGLGAKKRIVLYDTLIKDHTADELVAVLAHEIGHYKHKHTRSSIIISLLQTGLMLFLLSLFIAPGGAIAEASALAFDAKPSFQIGMLIFGILYSPVSEILGVMMNWLSRKNEYEADAFAKQHASAKDLSSALIKLSKNSLSNINPHPYYVFINYSHPPLGYRLARLEE